MVKKRPTLVDVAEASGFSVALVSIVMREAPGASDETRRVVKEAAARIGYHPNRLARALRRTNSGLIGVSYALDASFHADLTKNLYQASFDRPYELTLSAHLPGRTERVALETLLHEQCEAIIVLGPAMSEAELARYGRETPLVVVARHLSQPVVVDVVTSDDYLGQRMAVDHAVSLGHRAIAHVDGGDQAGAPERRAGYRDAMVAHGLEAEVRVVAGGPEEPDGFAAALELLKGGDAPTAICGFNDDCATGVLAAATTLGLSVPDDLTIIGYDDSRRAETAHVPLTTISQRQDLMAVAALDRAIAQSTNPEPPQEVVLAPELVVRRSSGSVSAHV